MSARVASSLDTLSGRRLLIARVAWVAVAVTVLAIPTAANALISSEPAWWLPVRSLQILGSVCVVLFFLLFPGGLFVPRWTRWLAVAFIAYLSTTLSFQTCTLTRPSWRWVRSGCSWVTW